MKFRIIFNYYYVSFQKLLLYSSNNFYRCKINILYFCSISFSSAKNFIFKIEKLNYLNSFLNIYDKIQPNSYKYCQFIKEYPRKILVYAIYLNTNDTLSSYFKIYFLLNRYIYKKAAWGMHRHVSVVNRRKPVRTPWGYFSP